MQTITFYSYKGGTGRTLAVANTARFLARFGCRVFVLDLDLEAPGLHYKLGLRSRSDDASTSEANGSKGFVDFAHYIKTSGALPDLEPYVHEISELPQRSTGQIWLMPAGNAPSAAYSQQLAALKLDELFQYSETSQVAVAIPLFLALKRKIEETYAPDYFLIDSRTGVTEIGSVAVRVLPDTVVSLIHNNDENLAGARKVLRNIEVAPRLPGKKGIDLVAALSRIPEMPRNEESKLLDSLRTYFNEPAGEAEGTLHLREILPLHADPDLQVSETLLFGASITANESILLRDYFKLFRRLELHANLPSNAQAVLKELAEADNNQGIRPLLLSNRRLKGESATAPVDVSRRLKTRDIPAIKVVQPAYLQGPQYVKFSLGVLHYLQKIEDISTVDALPDDDVRWDILAVHLREGVVDFCADIYYLTENRAHLVEIVQLGWSHTFVAFHRTGSRVAEELDCKHSGDLTETIKTLLAGIPDLAVGVRGDTPAASEANRRLSPILKGRNLVSKESEAGLFEWIDDGTNGEGLVICDHPIAAKLQKAAEDKKRSYSIGPTFTFDRPIPVGIVYPREDQKWWKKLSKAIADTLVKLLSTGTWNWAKGQSDGVCEDFESIFLTPLSVADLHTALLLDLPFEEALEWDRSYQAVLSSKTAEGVDK